MALKHCEICDHPFAEAHRIYLGEWGGLYVWDNIAWLCPNHHAAVHLFTKFYYTGTVTLSEEELFLAYHTDRPLKLFCLEYIKPVVRRRLVEEGRWHPYKRTLPPPEEERRRAREINKTEIRRKGFERLKRRAREQREEREDANG